MNRENLLYLHNMEEKVLTPADKAVASDNIYTLNTFVRDGYLRVGAAVPEVRIANVSSNVESILKTARKAVGLGIDVLVFPELSMTGYTCADLFHQQQLIDDVAEGIKTLVSEDLGKLSIVVGAPIVFRNALYNCAIVVSEGRVAGIVPKSYLPNYNEFYEKRWFASGKNIKQESVRFGNIDIPFGTDLLFAKGDAVIGIEICEDLWVPVPPSSIAALNGANVLLNLSATNEVVGKHDYLVSLIRQQSAKTVSAYVYSSSGFAESSTDLVFSGNAVIAENGKILNESERFSNNDDGFIRFSDVDIQMLKRDRLHISSFADNSDVYQSQYRTVYLEGSLNPEGKSKLKRLVDPMPFVPAEGQGWEERCAEIINIQSEGLKRRIWQLRGAESVVGISGGLDSTLALLVSVEAYDRLGLDRKKITGITMPGFGTTGRTKNNATKLMELLGISTKEISISAAARQHLSDIGHPESIHDVTYENAQARERTQVLMDYANSRNGIVIGTGDLSELALGWCTYNGDHMSMYGVNASIPKTLVRHLVRWFANRTDDMELRATLLDILDTPVSPELLPSDANGNIEQKTEDIVGPYELHDFFLYNKIRNGFSPEKTMRLACLAFEGKYSPDIIARWLKTFDRRFATQQFKRSCMPDGPKVGSVCLSPRGDWRMPSDV